MVIVYCIIIWLIIDSSTCMYNELIFYERVNTGIVHLKSYQKHDCN